MRAPRFQAEHLGLQLHHVVGQEEQGQHGGLREIRLEHVALDERRFVADAFFAAVRLDNSTIAGLNSKPTARAPRLAAAMMLPPVAGAEIDDVVLRRDARHVQHPLDQRLRRRHPHDVLAGLADLGPELASQPARQPRRRPPPRNRLPPTPAPPIASSSRSLSWLKIIRESSLSTPSRSSEGWRLS